MSWGYKLMITFIAFAGMMSYMVYRCYGTNFELVEKEYYKSELKYQDVIDGSGNAARLSSLPEVKQSGDNIVLQMPAEMKNTKLSGSVLFYCSYNSVNDKIFTLAVDNTGKQEFGNTLAHGTYTIKISWNSNGKKYYSEKGITIL